MPDDIINQTLIGSKLQTYEPSYSKMSPEDIMNKNKQYIKSDSDSFQTKLTSDDERKFNEWIKQNPHIPFDPSKTADYDMRGFWKGIQDKDPTAITAINSNDGMPHFPDKYKTPYHESFSRESQYANLKAPAWNNKDQLVDSFGNIVFDERSAVSARTPLSQKIQSLISFK